ncbi:MAG: MmcQ/YjbR family DNA-binding protein [Thermoanaerobaculia bacterium]|nr:MmcQ/YjbR family DNA-binding protein [Thermoanaerobaculia bacterium]
MGGKLPAMVLDDDPLPRLRALCLAQPGATEKISHGEPTWFAGKKGVFVMFSDHHHDGRVAFHCAAPEGMQETLVQTRPERFFRPPYVGHRGWLGVYLDTPGVDWDEVADFVETAYEIVSRRR